MKPEYEPKTIEQKLGYVVEECGEVLAAIGKAQRWGLGACNPELPIPEREYNRDWILRELEDLSRAIFGLRTHLMIMITDEELERHGSPR
jgi:NTP pyrophosphatase (non-canonical NTP hydrolase)